MVATGVVVGSREHLEDMRTLSQSPKILRFMSDTPSTPMALLDYNIILLNTNAGRAWPAASPSEARRNTIAARSEDFDRRPARVKLVPIRATLKPIVCFLGNESIASRHFVAVLVFRLAVALSEFPKNYVQKAGEEIMIPREEFQKMGIERAARRIQSSSTSKSDR